MTRPQSTVTYVDETADPADFVDKATAWDGCQKSYDQGWNAAFYEAARLADLQGHWKLASELRRRGTRGTAA